MKRAKCPKCGKSVTKSEKFGDLWDRKDTKKESKMAKFLGGAYVGSFKKHKCK